MPVSSYPSLPQRARDILLEHGPMAADSRLRLHVDRSCPGADQRTYQSVGDVLDDVLARTPTYQPLTPCASCGLSLEPWIDLVYDVRDVSPPPHGDALQRATRTRDLTTPDWKLALQAPACCRPHLHTDALSDTARHALELALAERMHQHVRSLDPHTGCERTHALLVPPAALGQGWSELTPALELLRIQHPWATAVHDVDAVLVAFQLPEHAARELATDLGELAHLLPAADLDETTWKVLAALAVTQHAGSEARTLVADLPRMLTVARAATTT